MSDPNRRTRPGYPPQTGYPDGWPGDPRSQQPPQDQGYPQQPQSGQPAWPPQPDGRGGYSQPDDHGARHGWPGQGYGDGGGAHGRGADPYGYPQQTDYPPQQGYGRQQGYPQDHGQPRGGDPGGYGGYRHPDEPEAFAEDPYSQPTLGAGQPHGYRPQPHSAPHGQASPYATQFEAYQPQDHGGQAGPTAGGYDYGDPRYPHAPSGQAGGHHEPQLRGPQYDDWPSQAAPGGHGAGPRFPEADPRGYAGYGQEPGGYQGYAGGHQGEYAQEGWPQGYAEPPAEPGFANGQDRHEPGLNWPGAEAGAFAGQRPGAGAGYGGHGDAQAPGHSLAVNEDYNEDYDEDDDEDDAPARRMPLMAKVAAVIVGSVVIGGGLVFGYKSFMGGSNDGKSLTVVRSSGEAAKSRPSDPGGRRFDHTDSKMMDRMSDGTRRVSTVMIGRDGSVVAPGEPSLPQGGPPAQPVVNVPGLTIVDGFAGQRAATGLGGPRPSVGGPGGGGPIVVSPPNTQANAAATKTRPQSKLSPVRPAVVTRKTEPPRAPSTADVPRVPKAPATKTTAANPPPAAPTRTAAVTPPSIPRATPRKTAPRAAPPATTGNGYVAVLASVPVSTSSRLDALKTFADIQQNYGTVLQNRTPDVREADLGTRGRYHRLMVGPPGSKESATALCKQLKDAGYPSCWITAY